MQFKSSCTPKFRGSEIIQLQNYKTATLQDVAAVRSAFDKFPKNSEVLPQDKSKDDIILVDSVIVALHDLNYAHTSPDNMIINYCNNFDRKEYCPKIYVIQFAATAMKKDSLNVTLLQATETVSDGSGDTYATDTTFMESLVAAGAGLSLVDYVVTSAKIIKNPPVVFALICPLGHHAVPDGPMGPYFAGNVAIAARYAQRAHGLKCWDLIIS
ncbi:histone deacetylase 14 [Tanacetum coccineum]